MFRTLMKAAIVAAGLFTAAPLMAQQPQPMAPAPRAFVARPHRMAMQGPRRRRIRRRRRRVMMMRRMQGTRMHAMRMRAMRTRYMRNRALI